MAQKDIFLPDYGSCVGWDRALHERVREAPAQQVASEQDIYFYKNEDRNGAGMDPVIDHSIRR